MYPHERSLVNEMVGKPFVLLGVNNDPLETARQAVHENSLNWRSFQDSHEGRETAISEDWMVSVWPTILILDGGRKIRYRGHDGMEATQVAEELVAQMSAE